MTLLGQQGALWLSWQDARCTPLLIDQQAEAKLPLFIEEPQRIGQMTQSKFSEPLFDLPRVGRKVASVSRPFSRRLSEAIHERLVTNSDLLSLNSAFQSINQSRKRRETLESGTTDIDKAQFIDYN